jgi:hypothetical protein
MLLNEYDWKIFRNAFNLFYDDFLIILITLKEVII